VEPKGPCMPEEVWIGLDLGTQSARALAVSGDGDVLAAGARPLRGRREGDRHEQDPDAWWTALSAACREAMARVAPEAVRGVACCSTSGTVLLLGAPGVPLTAGLMYDDGRAEEEAGRVEAAGAATWRALGYRMGASWGLPKLVWLERHRGIPAGARLGHQADLVCERLVGAPLPTDSSHALKSGFDLLAGAWPADVLDALGVPPDALPDVVAPGTRLGEVGAAGAAATGLPAGTPVLAGMTDGCAAQIGAGALETGSWNAVLGTTLVLKGRTEELLHDPSGAVYSHRSPDGGWLPGGASSAGAGVLADEFAGRDLRALDEQAAHREPAGAVVYPLVSARGERFPFLAPDAERLTLGSPADEVDRYAAILQGVAFAERLCFDHLDRLGAPTDGTLTLTGGGARSPYWCQLRADVLGRPVRLLEHADPALGMAVLAASTARGSLTAAARAMVRVRAEIEPRPDRAGRFDAPYRRLLDGLAERGWLDPGLARHAAGRIAA
jgi:D-ribulokinase